MGTLAKGLIFWLAILSPLDSIAEVNTQDASYERTDEDQITKDFRISRSYSSRSLHMGLFGLGWCSELDQHLTQNEDRLEIHYCDLQIPQRTLKVETRNKGIPSAYSYTLAQRKYHFSPDGRLTKIGVAKNQNVHLFYDSRGMLNEIQNGQTRSSVLVKMDFRRGRIVGLSESTQYQYEGSHLIKVKSSSRGTVNYQYDEASNLTQVSTRDSRKQEMRYDIQRDWIRWVKDEKGCEHFFNYQKIQGSGGHLATHEVQCGGRWVKREQQTYQFQKSPNQQTYLTKIETKEIESDNE